ncbi:FkbM family methyltransferase [Hymenobacter aerilatus]|uniref:FkbM family methyltransferase n=1 Tax=Hymenobacter aerilatus TaxID=2932251 RepID=A0A8T9T0Y6_9BACT|nr:FkbM family methyltransferase [Hymenobacter aerilatus]UOR06180.1 FkbM family methyltransferase [Hymenobacter aerilatus]
MAYRSRYRGREGLEVFRVLTALWLKTTFKWTPSGGMYRQRLFGFTVEGSSYELLLRLFKELFLVEPYAFEPATSTPYIVDAGANIGMAVLYFKKQFPTAHIIAFEPNPEAFRLLACNVAANNLRNVQLHNVALAPTQGELPFYFGTDGASLTGSLHPHATGVQTVLVPTRRLADYFDATPIFHLLKLDVEGAEAGILADLAATGLLPRFQQYVVEFHYSIGTTESAQLAACLQAFEQRGFAYSIRQALPRLAHSQDIILHFWQRSYL